MGNMFTYTPNEAEAIIDAAKKLSEAASTLKELESSDLAPDALSDAWDNAYEWLYRANEVFKALVAGEKTDG